MEIIFDRTQPINRNLNYSVKTNNNANVITFILNDQQETIFLHNLTCYVKVQATSFLDKEHAEYSYEGDLIKVTWVMKRKVTQFKTIQVQLQFEGGDDIVWQTEIFNMTLANTIPADKEIPNKYPSILSQIEGELDNHEGRIDTLEDSVDRLETNKQDKLVSGENIKTINGESVLGSGDIEIKGSSGEIINIDDGLTEEIREKVIENPSAMLSYAGYVYSPCYEGWQTETELPGLYSNNSANERAVYWLEVNWEDLSYEGPFDRYYADPDNHNEFTSYQTFSSNNGPTFGEHGDTKAQLGFTSYVTGMNYKRALMGMYKGNQLTCFRVLYEHGPEDDGYALDLGDIGFTIDYFDDAIRMWDNLFKVNDSYAFLNVPLTVNTLKSSQGNVTIQTLNIEDKTNKVTSLSSSSTDIQYPSAKCVYDLSVNLREVAEGKCKSYTISVSDNPVFDTQNSSINGRDVSSIIDISGNTIRLSDLKNGDVILVIEIDKPDRWYSDSDAKFYVLETTKVDLSNYYNKAQVDEAIANSLSYGGYNTISDANDAELNKFYWISGKTTNFPNNDSRVGLLMNMGYSSSYRTQIYILGYGSEAPKYYVRNIIGSTWTNWYQLATEAYVQSELIPYATKTYVQEQISAIVLTPYETKVDATAKYNELNGKINDEKNRAQLSESGLDNRISHIEGLIPSQATEQNKLADKGFVNSSIVTNTAYFRGTYNVVSDLGLTVNATHEQIGSALGNEIGTSTNNDYAFVSFPDAIEPTQFTKFERYKYNSDTQNWSFEFELNNSSFTAEQWASINSGITAEQIAKFVKNDSDQTLSGIITLLSALQFDNQSYQVFKDGNVLRIRVNGTEVLALGSSSCAVNSVFRANRDNSKDLGQKTVRWKDLYLSGLLKDGTNEIAISELGAVKIFTPASSTLTEAEYTEMTNGKAHMTVSSFFGFDWCIFLPPNRENSASKYGLLISNYGLRGYFINKSTRTISLAGLEIGLWELSCVSSFNGKAIPAYPSNTGTFVLKCVNGTLTWVQE